MSKIKRIHSRSKSSLFLMEMILSLLFFALACSVCIQISFLSFRARHEARLLNHMQELTITTGEVLEGWEGTAADYCLLLKEVGLLPEILPVQHYEGEGSPSACIRLYFDRSFAPCEAEGALWELQLTLFRESYEKSLTAQLLEKQEDGSFAPTDQSFHTAFPAGRREAAR